MGGERGRSVVVDLEKRGDGETGIVDGIGFEDVCDDLEGADGIDVGG